jgi:hypothetical protein
VANARLRDAPARQVDAHRPRRGRGRGDDETPESLETDHAAPLNGLLAAPAARASS